MADEQNEQPALGEAEIRQSTAPSAKGKKHPSPFDATGSRAGLASRVALGMEACPECGSIHPSRWARWQAVGVLESGALVGPVCAARSPLMLNVYGRVWRVLAVDQPSKHQFPRLQVEAVQPGPWLRDGEDARAWVDGRAVFPIDEQLGR